MKKIDFTCKKITFQEIVQCNFGLNNTEFLIFDELIKNKKGLSVKELVDKVQKDRTTVQKILIKLSKRDLVMKRQINLDRGFMFVYFSKNKKEIIDEIESNVNSYFKNIQEAIVDWKKEF